MASKWISKSAVVTGVVLTAIVAGIGAQPQDDAASVGARQAAAHRKAGLRGAASVTGSYIGQVHAAELGSPTSLRALTASAEAIVLATIDSNRCHLTSDGYSILTRYEATVERAFKGAVKKGMELSLIVPGGRVAFDDGSWAQLNVPGLRRPEDGKRYVMFLRNAHSVHAAEPAVIDKNSYVPAFGPLGLYRIDADTARVFPAGNVRSALARVIVAQRLTGPAFMEQIDEIVRNQAGFAKTAR